MTVPPPEPKQKKHFPASMGVSVFLPKPPLPVRGADGDARMAQRFDEDGLHLLVDHGGPELAPVARSYRPTRPT